MNIQNRGAGAALSQPTFAGAQKAGAMGYLKKMAGVSALAALALGAMAPAKADAFTRSQDSGMVTAQLVASQSGISIQNALTAKLILQAGKVGITFVGAAAEVAKQEKLSPQTQEALAMLLANLQKESINTDRMGVISGDKPLSKVQVELLEQYMDRMSNHFMTAFAMIPQADADKLTSRVRHIIGHEEDSVLTQSATQLLGLALRIFALEVDQLPIR
jgi:uncharacterized membrane protein (UPF0136 family)